VKYYSAPRSQPFAFICVPLRLTLLAVLAATLIQAQPSPSYKALHYPPLREIKIPNVAIFTLNNGIKLYLLEDHELPTIRGMALVRTGNLFDPKDKIGLASVTGTVMRTGGTHAQTGDKIDAELENIAASVESRIEESYGQVQFSTLKNTTDEVLGVFHDVLTQPEFREDKLELAKTQFRSSISRRNDDAAGIAQREFNDIVYGKNTPYGWQIEYETLDRIHRPDVQSFYQRYFFPANTILALTGDFKTDEMHAQLEKLFSDWTVKREPVPPFPPVDKNPHPGVFLALKTNVTQTNFMFGQLGGTLDDKDYPALEVMGDILGGSFRSRLFRKVRTDLGYAYNIYAGWSANYDHPGLFEIGGSTKSASTTEAIQASLSELEKMRTKEVAPDELEMAKSSVANSFVFNFDTPSKTLNRLVIYDYYGYPKDFIYRYQKGIQAVTAADILRVARERLDPKHLTVVAVGNPKEFGAALTTLGMPISDLDISIPEPKSQKTSAATANPESIAQGRDLLKKIQAAAGGLDKLSAIKDVRETRSMQFDASAGGLKSSQVNYFLLPSTFRQENVLPFGKVIAYSDGKNGFVHNPQMNMPLNGPLLKQIQGEILREYIGLLLSDHDANRTVSLAGEGMLQVSDKDSNSVDIKLDPSTGLIAAESYSQQQPAGPPSAITVALSDYREVDGIKMPFKMTISQGDKKVGEATVSEYKFNSGLKPEDLSKQQ
jgi:zinc protease